MLGAFPRRHKLFLCCNTQKPYSYPVRLMNYQNLRFRAHLMNLWKWLYNKMHTELKQEVWLVQSLMRVWAPHKSDMHAPAALQKLAIYSVLLGCLVIKIRAHDLLICLVVFLKRASIIHNRWSRGVVGITPDGMVHHTLQSVKWHLMQELIMIFTFGK